MIPTDRPSRQLAGKSETEVSTETNWHPQNPGRLIKQFNKVAKRQVKINSLWNLIYELKLQIEAAKTSLRTPSNRRIA